MQKVLMLLKWLPATFIVSCSWYLSSQPKLEHMPQFWNADKLVHCVCFAGLAFWVAFALGTGLKKIKRLSFPIVFVSVYGIIDEIHQSFISGRSSSAFDWIFDTLGAIIGSLIFYGIVSIHSNIEEK